ncbi:MAG: DNA/RNA non-specific endonuclease [Acidobacteria bacterium]|nr:DNA/RNA non-specific endonuclease [Acidobacteriota bacterium]
MPPPSGGAIAAPLGLTYRSSPAVYTKGTAITANVPASTGGAITSYSVAPALPAGLALNTSSGQITGIPTVVAPVATYTLVGSNGLGSATCLLSITVNDAAPASLTYPNPALSLRRGTAVTAQVPTTTGGAPATYTVAPALPAGLALNATTGVLTGTPTAVAASTTFTLVATNASGSATCQLTIAVVDVAPLSLSYPSATLTLYRGVPLAAQTPTSAGGPISTFSVAPALPAGLSLSATTGVLSGTPTTLQGAATYVVTGTNTGGSATAEVVISVGDPAPVISTQPAATGAAVGGSASFTVSAQGLTALSYQWRKDGTPLTSGGNIAGATSATLALSAITAGDAGSYSVVVSNTVGGVTFTTTSSAAALAVTTPPTIATQPGSLTITQGQDATFTVAASATGTLSYQWRKGASNLTNGGNISGATSASLTLTAAALADAGSYQVVVTNTQNAVASSVASSAATLTVNPYPASNLLVAGFPNPTTPGVSHAFTVIARDITNATTIGYRGTVHFTSTDPLAVLPADYQFVATDAGVHSFSASFGTEGAQSITATDTVTASIAGVQTGITVTSQPPTILTQPQTQTVVPPDGVTFTVSARANNGGSLSYAWKKNGTAIPGENGASTTVAATEFASNTDAYSVTVSEGSLSTDSATVYAQAAVTAPTYAGDPLPVPSRPLTILPSLHVDSVLFPNGAFRLGYDEALKNPVWTAYLNFPVTSPYANSTIDYTTDLRLQAPQVGRDDYTGIYTGGANVPNSYDRGHQVPRADVSYRYKTVAGDDATIMSNLVPQISQFNQQTWQKLEDLIGGTSGGATNGLTSFKGRVWVYTGSYFPTNPTWWNSTMTAGLRIAIPEACYKIVVHETTPGHPEVLAVLMPNAWGLVNSSTTVGAYVTSVARIEALTGINFFPNLATVAPTVDIPTWKATVDVRGWRTPFEQTTGPNVHMVQPSYDTTVELGTEVAFSGAATPNATAATGTTIASTTWNFGDATPTSTGLTSTHLYTGAGTYSVTFSANDSRPSP